MLARLVSLILVTTAIVIGSIRSSARAAENDATRFAASFKPGETLGRSGAANGRDVLEGLRSKKTERDKLSTGLHVSGTPEVRFGSDEEPRTAEATDEVRGLVTAKDEGWTPFVVPSDAETIELPELPTGLGVVPTYFGWFHPLSESARLLAETTPDHALRPRFPASVAAALRELDEQPDVASGARRAMRAFADGDYDDADMQLRRVVMRGDGLGILRFARAHVLFAKGDYDGASLEIRRGLDALPEWVETGAGLPALYRDVERLKEQRAALVAHVLENPRDGEALVVLAYVDFLSGRIEEAEVTFRLLASEREDDPLAGHFLAEILRIQRAAERAGR